ncbi:MAG TPA: hypothetical protein VFQ40_04785 [Actinomycetota bacterium]|nr:hypothetical protein [Actinomycetota bacterium]
MFKAARNGHAITCIGGCCTARRSVHAGQGGELRRHRRLSVRRAPTDEYPYDYELLVTTQDKVGKQIPATFWKALETTFFVRAMHSARFKVPIGTTIRPAVYVEHPEDGRAFLVVDVTEGGLRWERR